VKDVQRRGRGAAADRVRAGTTPEHAVADRRDQLSEQLDRLLKAASGLAATIAETERIAGRTAGVADAHRRLHRWDAAARGRGTAGGGWAPVVDGSHRGSDDGVSTTSGGSDRLVPLAEVARRTGRHPDLLRRWCLAGRLDAVRVGRVWCLTERSIGELARFQRRRRPQPIGPSD